jgi:hypothetical protein
MKRNLDRCEEVKRDRKKKKTPKEENGSERVKMKTIY